METKEEGITLGQLFGVIFGRKILLLIITLVIFIVGTLGLKFIYSDNQEYYSSNFTYTSTTLLNGQYVDGSTFDYRDLVSESYLIEIKNSSEDYSSIDIDKMIEKNGISISKSYEEDEDTETKIFTGFTITAKAEYFSDRAQAKKFISDVASSPVRKNKAILEKVIYTNNLTLFDTAESYEYMVELLSNQLTFLNTKYESLITDYGNLVVSDGNTLQSKLDTINAYFEIYSLSLLNDEIDRNGYVKNLESFKNDLIVKRESLLETYTANQILIDKLTADRNELISSLSSNSQLQTVEIDTYNSKIVSLTSENVEIATEIKNLNIKLGYVPNLGVESTYPNENTVVSVSEEQVQAFETKLESYKSKLATFTSEFASVEKNVIDENLKVSYDASGIVETNGGLSVILCALISLVIGFVVGCVVNLCLDYKKLSYNNNLEENTNAEEIPNKEE